LGRDSLLGMGTSAQKYIAQWSTYEAARGIELAALKAILGSSYDAESVTA